MPLVLHRRMEIRDTGTKGPVCKVLCTWQGPYSLVNIDIANIIDKLYIEQKVICHYPIISPGIHKERDKIKHGGQLSVLSGSLLVWSTLYTLEQSNRESRRKSVFCASVGSGERNADKYGIKINSSVLQFRSTSHLASLSMCILLQEASNSLFFEFCCSFGLDI